MLKEVTGDIFKTTCEIIINPTNSLGVHGAGLALQFKNKFRENCEFYTKICQSYHKDVLVLVPPIILEIENPNYEFKFICHFATKIDWKHDSEYEYVSKNLDILIEKLNKLQSPSIAMPALGCGLGGLKYDIVKNLIEYKFKDYENRVELYKPI